MNRRQKLSSLVLCGMFIATSACSDANRNQSASSTASGDVIERVAEKGPVKLVVSFTPREPRLSDLAEMEIDVTAKRNVEIKPPTFGQAVGDFVVRDYTEKTDKSAPKDAETQTRRFHYKLEPMNAGRHLIRSLAIDFVDNRPDSELKGQPSVIESEPFEVNVTSELGDQVPNLANLDPMLPPRQLSTSSTQSWLFVLAIVAAAVIVAVWLLRRKRAKIVEPRRMTPEEIAHEAFAALLAEDLPGKGLFKEFYLRLTGIVRHYIEGTTGLKAPEQTTEEFLDAIRTRNVFPLERSQRLKEFLEAADMVKFAGQQPDKVQIELAIARAREFVDLQSPRSSQSPVAAEEV